MRIITKLFSVMVLWSTCWAVSAQTCPANLGTTVNIASLPYNATGLTTCGAGNDITSANATVCGSGSYYGGEDLVFIFTPTATASYLINETSTSSWIGLMLYNGCPFLGQGGTCVGNAQSSTGSKSFIATLNAGTTYYLVVDTWPAPDCIPSFDLSIALAPPPPANDNCATAAAFPVIPTNGTCVTLSNQSTLAATNSGVTPTGACTTNSGSPDDDIWFSFVAPGPSVILEGTFVSGLTDVYWQVFSGACAASMTAILCTDTNAGGTLTGLTTGATYYVRLYTWATTGSTVQNVCLRTPPPPPPNDNCATATAFPVIPANGTCVTLTNQTTAGATNSGVTPTGACTTNSGTPDDDVWFSFVASAPTMYLEGTNVSGATDVYWQVFTAPCGTTMTALLCTDTNAGGTITGLTVGATYYIRLYTWSGTAGTSTVQNVCLRTPPANNECAGAVALTAGALGAPCGTPTSGTTVQATQSLAAITCNALTGTADDDVWYSFVATSNTHTVTVTGAGTFNAVVDVRAGGCPGANIACADATVTGTETVPVSGLVLGQTYFVRIYSFGTGAATQGAFTVCVTTPACTTPPTITNCPANQTVTANAACQGVVGTYTAGIVTVNPCGGTVTVTQSPAAGSTFTGTATVTLTATNASGATATCTFTLTTVDVTAPTITCPANITQPNTLNQCGRIVTFAAATATDNCGAATVTQIAGPASGSFFPVGTGTVTFRAQDAVGNSSTCILTITVNDTQLPTITCPANITQPNTAGQCGRIVNFATPVGTDNCPATTTQQGGLASGAFFPVGTTTNIFRITDPSGNTAQCSFTVVINDTQAPTLTCPPNLTVGTTGFTCAAQASQIQLGLPTATDNCIVSGAATNNAPATFPVGTTTVVFQVADPGGNTATCAMLVTVEDQQLPVIQCPATVQATADPATCTATVDFQATAYDNCPGGLVVTYSQDPLTEFDVDNTLVTATATDAGGNTNFCTFLVQVNRALEICNDIDDDCDGQTDEADDWNFADRIMAADGLAGEQFGTAVDVDGDYAIVGAKDKDAGGQTTGGAYLLHRDGAGNWHQLAKLVPAGLESGDSFGDAVAIDNEWLAVGAPGDDDQGNNAGAVYLYRQEGANPDLWMQIMKLTLPDGDDNDNFGVGLALHNDYLLVGAVGDDGAATDAGAVYVFRRNQGGPNNWGLVATLTAPFGSPNDLFGENIDYDGQRAIISARGDDQYGDNAGAAYIFARNAGGGNNWGLVTKLVAGDGETGDNFGSDVAISGNFALVGADQNDDKGLNAGKAYAFYRNQWNQQNSWGQLQGILDPNGQAGDNFGAAVAMDGDYAAIGAPGADFVSVGENVGKVMLYQRQQGGFVMIETLFNPAGAGANDYFGQELAMSSRTLLVGVPLDDIGLQLDRGSVAFFEALCAGNENREAEPSATAAATATVKAFPVPFSDRLTIRVEGITSARISMLNSLGQEVALVHDGVVPADGTQFEWQAARFQPGLYFVRVQTAAGVETKAVTLAR